jgi:uncharacterized protein DUF3558
MAGVLALVAGAALACSDETAGTPSPTSTSQAPPATTSSRATLPPFPGGSSTSTTEPSGGQGGPLAGTDPCTLSAQAAAQVNAGTGSPGDVGLGRQCRYQANGITLTVAIFDTQGLDDVVSSGQPQEIDLGSHRAKRGKEPPNLCVINIGTSDTSRVDVIAGARGDQSKACQVATQAATALEPSLPK